MDEFEKALAEQDEFDKALAEQGPVQVADTSSQAAAPFDPNQWQGGFNDLGVKLPEQAPYADVGEHIVGGLEQAGRDLLTPDVTVPTSVTEALNTSMTALPVLKLGQFGLDAASAVVQPLKQRYIDPPIRAAQDAARKYDEQELARRGIQGPEQYGPAGEQAFRNLVSMVYGDPARYQTPEKQAAGTSALAAAGEKALSFDQPNFKSSAIPEASLAGAFANTATAEFAYLPLYLVDGLGKSAAMKGATGGFLSDLVDPREGANPVNAALMGAGIGGAFEEAPRLAKKAGSAVKATAETFTEKVFKKVLGDLRGGSYLPEIKRAPTVARVKPLDIHRLVESAPTGGKITGKPTATVLDVDANGDLFAKSVSLQKEGPVVAEVAADKAGAKGEVTVATRRVADKLAAEGKPLPKNMVIADDAEELMAKTKVTGPGDLQPGDVMTGGMLGQADELIGQQVQKMEARGTFQPGMKDRAGNLLVGDGEVVGLHQLPQTDELIFWDNGLGPGRAERLSARDIHVAALDARNVVEVMTPEGPRLGVVREVREGQALVAPFDPAERIDRNLMEPVVVKVGEARALTDKQGRATRTLTEALDARDAAIAREAEELQAFIDETAAQFDALPSPNPTLASQVGPSPMPPDGKTGSLVADMAAVESKTVLDAPETTAIIAATSPPVLPGTPPPPPGVPPGVAGAMPPNSNLNARTVEEIAKLPPRTRALFMPPTADGPLIASSAAAAMRGAQNLESMLPRFIQAVKQTVTPRLLKETPGRQKLFNTLAREYLTSRSANPMKLLNEFPEIMADFEVHADDLRRGLAANEAELIALNWLDNPQTPAAPAGMKKFMDDLFADQLYVPDMYMFGELDKGEWSRMLKSREDIRAQGVRDYINQVLRPKYGSSKGEVAMKLEAEMQIDRFIGDPEA